MQHKKRSFGSFFFVSRFPLPRPFRPPAFPFFTARHGRSRGYPDGP